MTTTDQLAQGQQTQRSGSEGPHTPDRPVLHNRVRILMIHTSRYAFAGQARLAADVRVSRSTISRMLREKTYPSYHLIQAVTETLAAHLKRPLQPCNLFSTDGTYPEPSGCVLAGCSGCMPDTAYDSRGDLKPEWQNVRPGEWSYSPGTPQKGSQ